MDISPCASAHFFHPAHCRYVGQADINFVTSQVTGYLAAIHMAGVHANYYDAMLGFYAARAKNLLSNIGGEVTIKIATNDGGFIEKQVTTYKNWCRDVLFLDHQAIDDRIKFAELVLSYPIFVFCSRPFSFYRDKKDIIISALTPYASLAKICRDIYTDPMAEILQICPDAIEDFSENAETLKEFLKMRQVRFHVFPKRSSVPHLPSPDLSFLPHPNEDKPGDVPVADHPVTMLAAAFSKSGLTEKTGIYIPSHIMRDGVELDQGRFVADPYQTSILPDVLIFDQLYM